MAICPEGHQSRATDYCDECGLPIPEGGAAAPVPTPGQPESAGQQCPNCHAANPVDALFCEACGYDFVTGTLPRGSLAELLRQPLGTDPAQSEQPAAADPPIEIDWEPVPVTTDGPDQSDEQAEPEQQAQLEQQAEPEQQAQPEQQAEPEQHADADPDTAAPEPDTAAPEPAESADAALPAADSHSEDVPADNVPEDDPDEEVHALEDPTDPEVEAEIPTSSRPAPAKKRWVAEKWIDPDWYRLQESPDQLPSPGLPDIFPLPRSGALIGRVSRSQHIDPEVDCGVDTGCSRRHAQLSTDGVRWWIEDLGSANGTFVGETNGPLPTTAIAGRTELSGDSRIYIGGWTRIVVRPATPEEDELFPG